MKRIPSLTSGSENGCMPVKEKTVAVEGPNGTVVLLRIVLTLMPVVVNIRIYDYSKPSLYLLE